MVQPQTISDLPRCLTAIDEASSPRALAEVLARYALSHGASPPILAWALGGTQDAVGGDLPQSDHANDVPTPQRLEATRAADAVRSRLIDATADVEAASLVRIDAARGCSPNDAEAAYESSSAVTSVCFVVRYCEASGVGGRVIFPVEKGFLDSDAMAELRCVATLALVRLLVILRKGWREQSALTPREIDCVQWAAAGKSDWEIGAILNISRKTANYHIENAKRRLGVASRIQAILDAVHLGGIRPQG
ncbi:MAG: helix-turn-helix domain-containing protein [Pseudomonadota bacterium]